MNFLVKRKKIILGVDIGGTTIKIGILADHTLTNKIVHLTNKQPLSVLIKLLDSILLERSDIKAIAIATAGRVDIQTGIIVYASPNIPNWTGTPLKKILSERYGLPCFVLNDAQAAALGEARVRGIENLVMLTVGTGLGGGVVLNGNLVHGYRHEAGEVGHTILKPKGRVCNCGKRGCAEQYISMRVLHKYCKIRNRNELIRRFQEKDESVISGLERMCEDLAVLIDKIFLTIDPQIVVVGGGFSELGPGVLDVLRSKVEPYSSKSLYEPSQIEISLLKNDAGILGAAFYAEENLLRS